jgi:hypothetical protein
MAVTLCQVDYLCRHHGLPPVEIHAALQLMRAQFVFNSFLMILLANDIHNCRGARMINVLDNIGVPLYAFSNTQVEVWLIWGLVFLFLILTKLFQMHLPPLFRPPVGFFAEKVST